VEANMSDPLFVETSQGWINMALVTHVSIHGDDMWFVFDKNESGVPDVSLPRQEGHKVMRVVFEMRPECIGTLWHHGA
jgi:hypothetical protein